MRSIFIFFFTVSIFSSCIHRDDAHGPVSHFEHKNSERVQDLYVSWQNDSVIDVQATLLDHNQQSSFRWMATYHNHGADYDVFDGPDGTAQPVRKFNADADDPARVYTIVIAVDTSFALVIGDRSGPQLELDSVMVRKR